jgi:hypothetical protein
VQKIPSVKDYQGVKSATLTVAFRAREKDHRAGKKTGWDEIGVQLNAFWAADKTR